MGNGVSTTRDREVIHYSENSGKQVGQVRPRAKTMVSRRTERLQLERYWIHSTVGTRPKDAESVSPKDNMELNATAAAMAFERHCHDLVPQVGSAVQLLHYLTSKELIPEATTRRVLVSGLSTIERSKIILDAIGARIRSNPGVFRALISLLQRDITFQTFAKSLMDSYREFERTSPIPNDEELAFPAIARYAEFLKLCYRSLPTLQKYKCLPTPSKKSNRLAIVTERKGKKVRESISMEGILKPFGEEEKEPRCVLIEGEPGVGKSTLAAELCRRWDNIEAISKYSLVVLVKCQEKKVQEAKYILDLFYHPDITLQQEVVREVMERDGTGTLLIVDGIDQLLPSSLKTHPLARVLDGSVLQRATILLTCRSPSSCAGTKVEDVLADRRVEVGRHIEVLGFNEEDIEQHIQSSFSSVFSLTDEFSAYLSTNPAIQSSMHVSFNSSIVVEAYKQARRSGKPPPQTMSQIYDMTLQRILRHCTFVRGIGRQSSSSKASSLKRLEDLPPKVYQQLCNLAQFALSALLKEETIFHKLPRNCNHFGFMHATPELYVPIFSVSISYRFLHLGLQQYLAAFYLSKLPLSEQNKIFRQYFGSPHLDQVWKFLAGITHMKGSIWELARAEMCTDSSFSTFILRCLYEAHEYVSCESIVGPTAVFPQAQYGVEILPLDCFLLGCCLAHGKCTLSLKLRLDNEQLRMFTLGLRSRPPIPSASSSSSTIETLYLRPPVNQKTVALLSNLASSIMIHGLDLSHCDLEPSTLNALSVVVPRMANLKHLDIRGNPIGEGGQVQLLYALSESTNLQSLNAINTGIGSNDITALSLLILPTGSLKELKIGDEDMPEETVGALVSTIFAWSSLESLHLWFVDLTRHMDSVSKHLRFNFNIARLEFHACKIGREGSRTLAEAIRTNSDIKSLVLSMFDVPASYQIGTKGALALAEMLQLNQSLEALELSFDKSIGRNGALALVNSLQHNNTLKCLKVPQQHFECIEILAMDSRVKWSGP